MSAAGPVATGAVTVLLRAVRSESARVWSVRSSWVLACTTTLAVVGLGTIAGLDARDDPSIAAEGASAWDGGRFTTMFALFGIVALAVMAATADHATRAIVPTLQWTPRRGLLLWARTVVVAGTATVLGVAVVGAACVMVRVVAPAVGLPAGEGVRTLGTVAFVLGCWALLGVGLGLATRSTAAGLVCAFALLLVVPLVLGNLPYDWAVTLASHSPGASAIHLVTGEGLADSMTVTGSRVTLAAWAAAAVAAGGWRLVTRDANG